MKILTTLVLLALLTTTSALAGTLRDDIHRAAVRAAVQERAPVARAGNPYLWPGIALLGGGGALAVLAGTALKEQTAACVGDLFGVVCGGTESTNKAVLWSGIAAAGAGAVLLAVGARHAAQVTIAPGQVAVMRHVSW
jgi:hypothetical protein